jgi:hypothetical protein
VVRAMTPEELSDMLVRAMTPEELSDMTRSLDNAEPPARRRRLDIGPGFSIRKSNSSIGGRWAVVDHSTSLDIIRHHSTSLDNHSTARLCRAHAEGVHHSTPRFELSMQQFPNPARSTCWIQRFARRRAPIAASTLASPGRTGRHHGFNCIVPWRHQGCCR